MAIDGTTLSAPDEEAVTWYYRKHIGTVRTFGYPLVRLVAIAECGTRALLGAAFEPDRIGDLTYARGLLGHLDASMLLLADAYYDAFDFLEAVAGSGALLVLRSTRKRRPSLRHALADGSYLTTICSREHRAGRGYGRLEVRVIEALVTVTLADGTRHTELWRLLANLLDDQRYPAVDLLKLYHRRWQAETCYFSLKSTILDGRVLRSRSVPGLDQEIFALLTTYQALIRMAGDIAFATPGLSAQRMSFTVLFQAAADQITTSQSQNAVDPVVSLVGPIGRAVPDNLLPGRKRHRVKARYSKSASKYGLTRGDHPRTVPTYSLHVKMITDGTLDNPPPGEKQRCCTRRDMTPGGRAGPCRNMRHVNRHQPAEEHPPKAPHRHLCAAFAEYGGAL